MLTRHVPPLPKENDRFVVPPASLEDAMRARWALYDAVMRPDPEDHDHQCLLCPDPVIVGANRTLGYSISSEPPATMSQLRVATLLCQGHYDDWQFVQLCDELDWYVYHGLGQGWARYLYEEAEGVSQLDPVDPDNTESFRVFVRTEP